MAGRFTVETVFKGTDNTSGVISSIESKVRSMERALSGPSRFADRGIEAFKKVGKAVAYTGVAAAAAGAAFGLAIAPGADFDAAMSAVGAVSLMTRGQVADLEAEARRLGRTTKFSAAEVAGGMELMGKAGFDNTQIIAGIGPVLAAAAAEGAGLEETTSIVSNVMKGMGLAMSETGRVADVLTLASARTNSSISSLGEAMAIVAPTARQLNVPLEDAVAAIAMLQDVGLDASVSGSAVSTMLTNLAKPPKEVAAKMKAMGVSFQDARGNMLPFRDVVDNLAKAGKKAGGNMAQVAFFADLVGLRGQKAALNLKDLTDPMAKLRAELGTATGSAEKMAALKLDNFKGDMIFLGNAVKDLGIDFFDLVKGPLRDAAQGAKGWLADNQELIKSDVAGWIQGITENVKPMRENIEKAVNLIDNFKDGTVDAFDDSKSIKVFGAVLSTVFGGNDKNGPRMQAYELGRNIGSAVDKFILFTGVVKTAEFALWGLSNATKVAKAGKWLWDVGSAAGAAVKSFTTLQQIGPSSIVALSNSINGLNGGMGVVTESAGRFAGLRGLLNDTFDGWASKAGLAAVAIYSVYKAYEQADAFINENGGIEGTAAGAFGFLGLGAKDGWGFEGMYNNIDDTMSQQATLRHAKNFVGTPEPWTPSSAADAANGLAGRAPAPGDYAGQFGIGARPPTPGPFAGGYVMPTPQVVSRRDEGSAEQVKSNQQLQEVIRQLQGKIATPGGILKILLPKGATGEVSGAPGVEVLQSGSF
jgi:TP901 family phage tail tape measure protein